MLHPAIDDISLWYLNGNSSREGNSSDQHYLFIMIENNLLLQPIKNLFFKYTQRVPSSQKLPPPGEATRNTINILHLDHFQNKFTPRIFHFVANRSQWAAQVFGLWVVFNTFYQQVMISRGIIMNFSIDFPCSPPSSDVTSSECYNDFSTYFLMIFAEKNLCHCSANNLQCLGDMIITIFTTLSVSYTAKPLKDSQLRLIQLHNTGKIWEKGFYWKNCHLYHATISRLAKIFSTNLFLGA